MIGLALLGASLALAQPAPSAAQAAQAAVRPAQCADVLARAGRKPPHLRFTGCQILPQLQGRPMRATYVVPGRYAAATESYLVRAAGLRRLRRSCCQWDAPAGGFSAGGIRYRIMMGSGETRVAERTAWRRIEQFVVVVDAPTEDI